MSSAVGRCPREYPATARFGIVGAHLTNFGWNVIHDGGHGHQDHVQRSIKIARLHRTTETHLFLAEVCENDAIKHCRRHRCRIPFRTHWHYCKSCCVSLVKIMSQEQVHRLQLFVQCVHTPIDKPPPPTHPPPHTQRSTLWAQLPTL